MSKSSTSLRPPSRRRVVRWKYLRWIFGVFACMNVALFVRIHKLTIESDTTIPVQIPNFGRKNTGGTSSTVEGFPASPPSWENSLFEGSNYVTRYASVENKNLWDYSEILPAWMKDYFMWHKETRTWLLANPKEWKNIKYYIIECSDSFNACGGTADRLGPLPFHIQMANKMNRLLLIYWTKPAMLEEFLLPPQGGLDWRIPNLLVTELGFQKNNEGEEKKKIGRMATYEEKILKHGNNPLVVVLRVKFQSHNHGQESYDKNILVGQEPSYAQVYHDLWRICFTPVPAIAERIEQQMQLLNLQPGNYVTVHIRALYAVETRDDNLVEFWTQNGIRCATSNLFPIYKHGTNYDKIMASSPPILFVSDSTYATHIATQYGQQLGINVVHREHTSAHQPLHLEKAEAVGDFSAEEYYDTFVDIYMIGMSRCTAYNMGGFGRWGSMIGYNSTCVSFLKANMETCEFVSPDGIFRTAEGKQKIDEHFQAALSTPLFIPPMTAEDESSALIAVAETIQAWNFSATLSSYHLAEIMRTDPMVYTPFDDTENTNIWKNSKTIPKWMKTYFRWHRHQRQELLNSTDSTEIRLLVMECLGPHCGGTSDRLKPIPAMVRVAAVTNRLLLIHWTKPASLTEFLLPPKGGVDWRVPEWLHPSLMDGEVGFQAAEIELMAKSDRAIVRVRFQASDGGSDWYNGHLNGREAAFEDVFHDVWKFFFSPSPPIALRISKFMTLHGLIPGEYVAAHIRALYAVESRNVGQTKSWAMNAVNCASQLRPGKPIFVASDSEVASDYAIEYGSSMNGKVVTHQSNPDPPLHLDTAEKVTHTINGVDILQRYGPAHFYDTFVDAYLLALSKCVFIGKGGFGHWALLIGGNYSCTFRQKGFTDQGIKNPCDWAGAPGDGLPVSVKLETPLFLEPVNFSFVEDTTPDEIDIPPVLLEKERTDLELPSIDKISRTSWNVSDHLSSYDLNEVIQKDPLLYTTAGESLWDISSLIPTWMKDYFRWHRQQREALLNPHDWQSMRIFVMECLDFQDHCGGTSDRLKPTMTMLRMAAMTQRFLLIHWDSPKKLEEFLLPPKGGIDWRVPDWLHPLLMENETGSVISQIEQLANGANKTARAKFQSFDGGRGWFDGYLKEGETAFDDLFHDVWRVFFTPSPPVAIRIKEFMDRHGLVPGHYASAHIRALYALEFRAAGQTRAWVRNGVNCASRLRPGKPIFVASDSKYASEYAIEYGMKKNGKVVTHENNPDPPLHLDKGEEVMDLTNNIARRTQLPASAFYDTFIDLYLLAMGECVFISKGGFGHWALLIGGNLTCTIKQKRGKKGIQNPCNWTKSPGVENDFESHLTDPLFLEPMEYK